VQRGDVILAVNDSSLINVTHNEAVQCLKSSSSQPRRVLHVLQVGQPSTSSAAVATVNFRPMWTYWLSLPPYATFKTLSLHCVATVFATLSCSRAL